MNIFDSLSSLGSAKTTIVQQLVSADALAMPDRNFTFGSEYVDYTLRGGLPAAALHEFQAQNDMDQANASAFALLLALRAVGDEPILWVAEKRALARQGRLYPPGLVEMGMSPDRILYAEAADSLMALRIAADARRSVAVGAIILSLSGRKPKGLDLTATRRLSLYARDAMKPIFLLRDCVSSISTSAWSRWEIASAPSHALEANAPGQPVFDIKLTRHRGGKEGFSTLLEWDREKGKFAAHTRAVPAIPLFGEGFAAMRKCA